MFAYAYSLILIGSLSFISEGLNQTKYAWFAIGTGLASLILPLVRPSIGYANAPVAVRNTSKGSSESADQDEAYKVPVKAQPSELKFANIFGMSELKSKLLEAGQVILAGKVNGEAPRNGILLHGEPGNGKTVFAEALAGELNVPIIKLTYGDVSSMWIGQMPKVIANTFSYAKQCGPCVFFIDEIDSFIRNRDGNTSNTEDGKITNTILTEIVSLRGYPVILMGATNYFKDLDAAAVREGRFDFKIEVTPPDQVARLALLTQGLKKYASAASVHEADMEAMASRWNGFSVSRIMAISKAVADVLKSTGSAEIDHEVLAQALRQVQGRQDKDKSEGPKVADMVLADELREALGGISKRLQSALHFERHGGALPSGILFAGPPGTGKTAAARAIAAESGWAFLTVAGPDLLADRRKLEETFRKAKDQRPALIFIDEADEVLRSRQYNNASDIVNKLLTLMDGIEEKVKDVVWVAATNHPEQIDSALLRTGRFTEKITFEAPPAEYLPGHIKSWMARRNVRLAQGLSPLKVASMLEGNTIANIEGVLQHAVNTAIVAGVGEQGVEITPAGLERACQIVLGQ